MEPHATGPRPAPRTLRVLARLLGYPDATLRAHLPELRAALHAEAALSAEGLAGLDALIDALERQDPLDTEAEYVRLFDSGRRTALHLFEHVHGDSRERGPAMIDLARTYEQAGVYLAAGEMPDHLPVVLEFASTQPAAEASAFLREIAHLVNHIRAALEQHGSAYASVMAALLELAAVAVQPVALAEDESPDASWQEPAAFGGCAASGPASGVAGGVAAPQPVHFVRTRRRADRPAAREIGP